MASEMTTIVRFHELGGPEVLQLDQVPLPEPGAGEVRLRVKAIGLNRAECAFRAGRYLVQPKLPSKLGYEASGIVEAVGPGVDPSLVGKTMSSVPAFPADQYGVYGEVAILPVRAMAEYPARLSFEEGTSIWMQYITAWGAIVEQGRIRKGDFVLLTAASSSVGLAAIEIIKAEGGVSLAATRTRAKVDELLSLGADFVIATDEEDLVARVNQITGGQGARIVFDPVGGPGIEKLASATAAGGIIFEYGSLAPEPTPYPKFAAMSRHLWIKGYTLFEIMPDDALYARAKQYVYDKLEAEEFHPRIDRTFRLDEIQEAHRYMQANSHIGKIVVVV
jgi:NADPH:quinone reductase-like Zn-dependent oxidoreductase